MLSNKPAKESTIETIMKEKEIKEKPSSNPDDLLEQEPVAESPANLGILDYSA